MKRLFLIPLLMNPVLVKAEDQVNLAPSISVYYQSNPIDSQLRLNKDGWIDIEIKDNDFKSASIDIDGMSQDISQSEKIAISKSSHFITIVAFDQSGQETLRTIQVSQLSIPSLSSSYENQVTNSSTIDLNFSQSDLSEWNLLVSYQGIEDRMFPTSSFEVSRSGHYTLCLENKDNPSIKSNSISFDYYNKEPSISLEASSTYTNGPVTIHSVVDGDFIEKQYFLIRNEEKEEIVDGSLLTLNPEDEKDITYEVVGVAIDRFGQEAKNLINVRLDTLGPDLTLKNGSKWIEESTLTYKENMNLVLVSDGVISMNFIQNGMPVSYSSLQEALEHLSTNDSLLIEASSCDELGNSTKKSWVVRKENILNTIFDITNQSEEKKETKLSAESSNQLSLGNSYVLNQRLWSVDENQQVQLEQKEEVVWKRNKPKISIYTKSKDKKKICRIVLYRTEQGKEKFSWIRINQKRISLKNCKKDQFGNTYYEFTYSNSCKIQCKAINKDGKTRTIKKTIQNEKVEKESMKDWFGRMLSNLYYG